MADASVDAPSSRRHPLRAAAKIAKGVLDLDPVEIERSARELGATRRLLAPVAFVAGTLGLMVVGVKPLIKNWRLTLVELVPAAWVWLSMWNLRSHLFDQRGVHQVHGPWIALAAVVFIALGVLAFWCNALFIFAIGNSPPLLRPAVPKARAHLGTIFAWGIGIGSLHAFVSLWVSQRSETAYAISLCVVVALMMVTFVTVPASLAGYEKLQQSPRERVARVAVGGTLAAVVSTPGFLLDRIGLLLIGTRFQILGFALLSLGVALQVVATSSTKAVKLSTKLATTRNDGPTVTEPSPLPAPQ